MQDPICLITGATEGIGKATALELARKGFKVVLAARDPSKAEAVRREVDLLPGVPAADVIAADLASLDETRALAETFAHRYPRLDVLINNAGVFVPARTETGDGFDTITQVNYLSHFLLTQLLQSALEKSEQGRIINLSSRVYAFGRFDARTLRRETKSSVFRSYAASKLFMLMFTRALAERLAGTRVTATAVDPGIVRTRMMRRAPGAFRVLAYLSLPVSVSPARGAVTSVYLASSPDVAGVSGRLFARSRPIATRNAFDTAENRARLWDISVEAVHDVVAGAARRAG